MAFEGPERDGNSPGEVTQVPAACTYLIAPQTWILQREVRHRPELAILCLPRPLCIHIHRHGRFGDLRGLQLADHGLLVTGCRHHVPAADREMNHRSSRRALAAATARRDLRPRRSPGGLAGEPSPAATLGDVHGSMPGVTRGTARGTAHRIIPARPVLSVRFPELSVQSARTVHGPHLW
jgi:hypothetical protein